MKFKSIDPITVPCTHNAIYWEEVHPSQLLEDEDDVYEIIKALETLDYFIAQAETAGVLVEKVRI